MPTEPPRNPLIPSARLLAKLGSIARHVEEAIGDSAHPSDIRAAESLLSDPEVAKWMSQMDELGLLPVKR